MKMAQTLWREGRWSSPLPKELDGEQTISFVFFGPDFDLSIPLRDLRQNLPRAHLIGCSGAGEIAGAELVDQTAVVTTVQFERSQLSCTYEAVTSAADSFAAGVRLAGRVQEPGLRAIYILSEGLEINGTELVRGIYSVLGKQVIVAGGLAGDGSRFRETTILSDDYLGSGMVAAVGLVGDHLQIKARADAGWLPFGSLRKITKATGNILYELDGKPALAVYREFLGQAAAKLPSSALMFPLLLGPNHDERSRHTVRTVLAVDDQAMSMTFAGDMPLGEQVRFMRAEEKRLIAAAGTCAEQCSLGLDAGRPTLSLMVSCVGRRLVLGSSVEDEIEAVYAHLAKGSVQAGFYSYGELAPGAQGWSDLHNQTVTLAWLQEKDAA